MCLKCTLSTFLLLLAVQFSFPQSSHRVIPQHFFSRYPEVSDFYGGDLQELAEKLHRSDLSFVMYYAPWDRESQLARPQFAAAASVLNDQVLFAAINCWQPDSSCRMNHKVTHFPAMVLHVNTGANKGHGSHESRALSYNGPLGSEHLVRFVHAAFRPYRHVADRKQLAALQLTHSAIVLTYVSPAAGGGDVGPEEELRAVNQLALFYRAALHWLEYDKRKEVCWAVITDTSLAVQLGVITANNDGGKLSPIRMLIADINYVFNASSVSYDEPRPIIEWVSRHLTGVAGWVEVSGRKSSALNTLLHKGPALVVFAPDVPQYDTNACFDVVRGLWLQYSTCPAEGVSVHNTRAGRMAQFLLSAQKRAASDRAALAAHCSQERVERAQQPDQSNLSEDCSVSGAEANSCLDGENYCPEGHFTCHRFMPFFAKSGGGVGELVWSVMDGACQSLFGYSQPAVSPPCVARQRSNVSLPAAASSKCSAGVVGGSVYDVDVAATEERWWRHRCRQTGVTDTPHDDSDRLTPLQYDIGGNVCSGNTTLQFGVIDSVLHTDIAAHWGLNCSEHPQAVCGCGALVDVSGEWHHVLDGALTPASLTAALRDYHAGSLHRSEISRPAPSQYRSDYSSQQALPIDAADSAHYGSASIVRDVRSEVMASIQRYFAEKFSNVDSSYSDSIKPQLAVDQYPNTVVDCSHTEHAEHQQCAEEPSDDTARLTGEDVSIRELSADDYFNVTQAPGQAWLVLHYSRSCGPCTAASHALLMAAAHLTEQCGAVGHAAQENDLETENNIPTIPKARESAGDASTVEDLGDLIAPIDEIMEHHTARETDIIASDIKKDGKKNSEISQDGLRKQTSSGSASSKENSSEGSGTNRTSGSRNPALSNVQFARIDVSANTLPWNLNFAHLPFFIFYPANNKGDSRVFDPDLPVTSHNLVNFLAARLGAHTRLRLAASGCDELCRTQLTNRVPVEVAQVAKQLLSTTQRLHRVTDALHLHYNENNLVSPHSYSFNNRINERKYKNIDDEIAQSMDRSDVEEDMDSLKNKLNQQSNSKSDNINVNTNNYDATPSNVMHELDSSISVIADQENNVFILSRADVLRLVRSSLTSKVKSLRGRHRYLLRLQDFLPSVDSEGRVKSDVWRTFLRTL